MNISKSGGKKMSAAGKIILAFGLIAIMALALVSGGCSPDRKGTPKANQPPQVFITNTPPDEGQFSRNPELNWYATDIDGYIVYFRYSVLKQEEIKINGNPVPIDEFIDSAPETQYPWIYLGVDLDNPQSTATVRLFANRDFPVDSFVTQYFFIQVEDNNGLKSEIKYRRYSRNDNYPNTHILSTEKFFINAKDSMAVAPGVVIRFDGADSADWGRAKPPLDFEWRLFGPFSETEKFFYKWRMEDSVFNPVTREFEYTDSSRVLDVAAIPSPYHLEVDSGEFIDVPQPLRHSQGRNFRNDPTDVWVADEQVTIYDVFKGLGIEKTSKYKFLFWVRSRDDGSVPDPSPAFSQFFVYEALFEQGVMIFDETYYTAPAGRWYPVNIDTIKSLMTKYLLRAGYPDAYGQTDSIIEFYNISINSPNIKVVEDSLLLAIFSHKIVILYNDDTSGPMDENQGFGYPFLTFAAINLGASGWALVRNLCGLTDLNEPGSLATTRNMTPAFQSVFGLSQVTGEGWVYMAMGLGKPQQQLKGFIEEFIEARSNNDDYPDIKVDTALVNTRYRRWLFQSEHRFDALPEVGIGVRTPFAAPLYLYNSKLGETSPYPGKVMGVRSQIGNMRTACFMFTPTGMDTVAMQETFDRMLPWLGDKFLPNASKSMAGDAYDSPGQIYERREFIKKFMRTISEHMENREAAGVYQYIPPFEESQAQ